MVLITQTLKFKNIEIQKRKDLFLNVTSRISPSRISRPISFKEEETSQEKCIFCKNNLHKYVNTIINNKEYKKGDSIIFYNKYPFASHHLVGILTEKHTLDLSEFKKEMFENVLELLEEYAKSTNIIEDHNFYFNMNFSAMAGASQQHPHVQAFFETEKTEMHNTIEENKKYFYEWLEEHEERGLRFRRRDIDYIINFAPLGETNITLRFPFFNSKNMLSSYGRERISEEIVKILHLYGKMKRYAFNFSIFPTSVGTFGIFITRQQSKRKYTNDKGFLETILYENTISTIPERFAEIVKSNLK